tara:strand:- start:750 stop:986 length:237 start_codon:yes stop_codon:yes gene_type:complete
MTEGCRVAYENAVRKSGPKGIKGTLKKGLKFAGGKNKNGNPIVVKATAECKNAKNKSPLAYLIKNPIFKKNGNNSIKK